MTLQLDAGGGQTAIKAERDLSARMVDRAPCGEAVSDNMQFAVAPLKLRIDIVIRSGVG